MHASDALAAVAAVCPRGYARVEGLATQLAWKEHGEAHESPKPMEYWIRALDPTAD